MNKYEALRILGLGREASLEDARRAYREQVKLWHPDRYSDSPALKSIAHKNVQDANRAWAFLRPRLPKKAPHAKVTPATLQTAARVAPHDRLKIMPAPRIRAGRMIRQGVLKLTPLLERIRQIKIGGLADWLKQDPNRGYRAWYRYSRSEKNADHAGRPSFDQTLARALESRRNGSWSAPAATGRGRDSTHSGDTSGNDHDHRPDEDRIAAVDPVKPSLKP